MQETITPRPVAGRLSDPAMSPGTDPRMDPGVRSTMQKVGAADLPGPLPLTPETPREALLEFAKAVEDGTEMMIATALNSPDATAPGEVLTLTGRDGNTITLYVHRPAGHDATVLPAIVHLHGGGMVTGSATSPVYLNWRNKLAAAGVVVIGVEFRNAGGSLGSHPFPAGLNDCIDAIRWIAARRSDLGINRLVVSGESGGANLALTAAISANREGWVDEIDGVYVQCPYIAGPDVWSNPAVRFSSLEENDGYLMGLDQLAVMAELYDPKGDNSSEALCWAYQATESDLVGLPPHIVDTYELDPLRDEGIAYVRKLRSAGVHAVGRIVLGLPHAGDVFFGSDTPGLVEASVTGITGFTKSL